MPLRETEAIVLRTYRLGEADKIVSLFTRQFGRLKAVAAGAQRAKSRYGGSLEPLSYIRLWIFERENRDLLRLNSAELLESFFEMQREYRGQIAATYMCEVCERLLPEREVNERAFRLLLAVVRGMKQSGDIGRPLLYFNYWLLRLGGFLPDLEQCAACGGTLNQEKAFYRDDAEGLFCRSCVGRRGHNVAAQRDASTIDNGSTEFPANGWRALSVEALALSRLCRTMPLDRWLGAGNSGSACREARMFLEELVELNTEKQLVTRGLLNEILSDSYQAHVSATAAEPASGP
jgi:DNA repair protein RecO (recombination protein O)